DDPLNTDQISQEIITGRIFIHEYKNTDVTKHVNFRGVVCNDHSSFLQALSEETFNNNDDNNDYDNNVDYNDDNNESKPLGTIFNSTNELFQSNKKHIELKAQNLLLEHKILDIGKLEVNQRNNYY